MYSELCQRPQHLVSNWRQTAEEDKNPAIPSVSLKHAEHCPSVPNDSAPGSLTQTFHSRDKHIALPALGFFRPDPREQSSVAAWLQAVSVLLLAHDSPCAVGLLPLPRQELQSHSALHSAD